MENTFEVKLDLENDAMQTPQQVANVLRELASRLEDGEDFSFWRNLKDENGNTVGRAKRFKDGNSF